MMFRPIQAALLLIFLSILSFAQTAPTPTPKQDAVIEDDEVIKVDSKLVVVPVSVTDAQGQPVSGLKVSDFRLLEETRLQQLDQISPAEDVPLEIALLVDISSSVGPMFEMEKLAAGKFLRDVMRPADRATVFTVGTKPFLL